MSSRRGLPIDLKNTLQVDSARYCCLVKGSKITRKGIHSTRAFRARACRQVPEFSRPIREVAEEMGVRPDTLRTWLHRQRVEVGDGIHAALDVE